MRDYDRNGIKQATRQKVKTLNFAKITNGQRAVEPRAAIVKMLEPW